MTTYDPYYMPDKTVSGVTYPGLGSLVDANGKSLIDIWVPYCTIWDADTVKTWTSPPKSSEYWCYDSGTLSNISDTGLAWRSLFWNMYSKGSKGFVYWSTNRSGLDPWTYPNIIVPGGERWHEGEGIFFYPALKKPGTTETKVIDRLVPSIRWELMREGSEDYDYLKTLHYLVTAAENKLKSSPSNKTSDTSVSIPLMVQRC